MFSRGRFLVATGALALVPALPATASIAQLTNNYTKPWTLDEHFREELGPGPTVYFFVRPPLCRLGDIVSMSFCFYTTDGKQYGNCIDLDMYQTAGLMRACAVHNARSLGWLAKTTWVALGKPVTKRHINQSVLFTSHLGIPKTMFPLPIQDLL